MRLDVPMNVHITKYTKIADRSLLGTTKIMNTSFWCAEGAIRLLSKKNRIVQECMIIMETMSIHMSTARNVSISGSENLNGSYIDEKLNNTYKEIIASHEPGLSIITAMGVRALLEGICVVEGIDDKKAWGLAKKIKELNNSVNIPNSIIEGLNGIKFIGHDAAHRLNEPDKKTLGLSIDLIGLYFPTFMNLNSSFNRRRSE